MAVAQQKMWGMCNQEVHLIFVGNCTEYLVYFLLQKVGLLQNIELHQCQSR